MPLPEGGRGGDLVLNAWQFAFILDTTKGQTNVCVGPFKLSLAQSDQPVKFKDNKFVDCTLNEAIQDFAMADEGSYLVLQNPAADTKAEHPPVGSNTAVELKYGRTTVVSGPARFPLWPGQTVQQIPGHVLRSNQYLVARVTNGDEATANWSKAVLKPQATTPTLPNPGENQEQTSGAAEIAPPAEAQASATKQLVTGQRLVIRGTDYSFFIPPTGVEVVAEERGKYVRDAVTLESLQYCVLLSEDGKKRFVQGPAVVFPEPNETFVMKNNERIFKAIELNPQMGIHIKVIADYTEGDVTFKAGQELFITGAEQQIYFPRSEHAIIPYRDGEQIHYAVVVPEGEARYVLDKATGKVETVKGPQMLLCNPVTHVIVRRVLTEREASLWFPNNVEVLEFNEGLRSARGTDQYLSEAAATTRGFVAADEYAGDRLTRRSAFTAPKTITLKSKLDGAVSINVWPGYAVQIVSKTGGRRTVVGPTNILLDFDESLGVFELSTGTPKSDKNPKKADVYLRVVGNKVSDVVKAETADLVNVDVKLSYRVNFVEEDQDTWFALDDYVGFLTDHLRSVIRGGVKKLGIEQFIKNPVDLLRDTVLGIPAADSGRPGKKFAENGMRVYDLEVLDVTIGDTTIANLLVTAQKEAVQQTLTLQKKERELELTQKTQAVERQIAEEKTTTQIAALDSELQVNNKRKEVDETKLKNDQALQVINDAMTTARLAIEKAEADQGLAIETAKQNLQLEELEAETKATVARFAAMEPKLVEALMAIGDKDLMTKIAQAIQVVPMGLDEGIGDVMERMFKGTIFASAIEGMNARSATIPVR